MRLVPPQRAIGRQRPSIGTDHHQGMGDNAFEIVFAERKIDHPDLVFLSDQQITDQRVGLLADLQRGLMDALSHQELVFLRQHRGNEHFVPGADLLLLDFDKLPDFSIQSGIFQSCEVFIRGALLNPAGNKGIQKGRCGCVGITVGQDFHPLGVDLRYPRQDGMEFRPIPRVSQLEVRNLQTHIGLLGDQDRLFNGFDETIPFIPHVRGIDTAVGRHLPAELNNLFRPGKAPRGINKPRG